VYTAQDPALAEYQTETFLPAAVEVVKRSRATVVLLGQTSQGRDLAPRLATRLESAAAMDAVGLAVEEGRLKVTRPCYGGRARQDLVITTDPQIVTVRPKSQEALPPDSGRRGAVEAVQVQVGAPRARLEGRDEAAGGGVRLDDAEIVVSGGRGLGAAEAFRDLEELAAIMGAAVGASRAACDLGWYPPSQQVGLTGTVVSPTLYLAVAISGASQHLAGCGGSKNIVAINKDPEANIFKFCRFGIVDDYKKVLPPLKEALRALLQNE
jgi:electron transfer flavoprotein alpha subunit